MPELVTTTIEVDLEACDKRSLQALLAHRGRRLDIDALRDTCDALIRLRDAHDGPAGGGYQGGHRSRSVACGNVTLHSLTHGARLALIDIDHWGLPIAWRESGMLEEWMLLVKAFVHAHSRDENVLAYLANPAQVADLVETWGRTCAATPDEVKAALAELDAPGVYPPAEASETGKKPGREAPPSYAELSTALAAPAATGYGKSPSPTSAGCSAKSAPETAGPNITPMASSIPTTSASTPAETGMPSGTVSSSPENKDSHQ